MHAPPANEVGIVVALPVEAAYLGNLRIAVAGIGAGRAAAAAESLIARGARALLSWGVAGGLSPALARGALVMPRVVVAQDRCWYSDPVWRESVARVLSPRATASGDLWCSPAPVCTLEEKRSLAARGLCAVDMESAAVATIAAKAGVPFLAIKAICDPAQRAVPAAAAGLLDDSGRISWRRLPAALLAGPSALQTLHRDFAAARRTLRATGCALQRAARQ